jgi:hypothetical protein
MARAAYSRVMRQRLFIVEKAALAGVLLASLVAGGCSSDSGEGGSSGAGGTGSDPQCAGAIEYFSGVEKTGTGGTKVAIISADPAAPHIGDNKWVILVTDAGGAPIDGATVVVQTKMPAHGGHTSPRVATVTPQGEGKYELDPVNFNMDKLWQITIQITPAGGDMDSVMFPFCIAE